MLLFGGGYGVSDISKTITAGTAMTYSIPTSLDPASNPHDSVSVDSIDSGLSSGSCNNNIAMLPSSDKISVDIFHCQPRGTFVITLRVDKDDDGPFKLAENPTLTLTVINQSPTIEQTFYTINIEVGAV